MESRRLDASEDPQNNSPRSSRLTADDELLLNIPIDLIIDIFLRLPLNSIARCRCVSKQWASVLRRPDFTELFFTNSLARTRVLFARLNTNEVLFFSLPQPQNLGENVSIIAADHRVSFPYNLFYKISSSVNGYICISHDPMLRRRKNPELEWVICNPSTGQSFTLPRTSMMTAMRSFLGYNPVEKQHKVLALTVLDKSVVDHQVLTLRGDENLSWRLIECDISHSYPGKKSICINGVLYYTAKASDLVDVIVCFDVRSEKFSFVNFMESVSPAYATLINFQGKLASVRPSKLLYLSGTSNSLEMWILEDPETHEWSKRIFSLPPMWKEATTKEFLYIVGVTDTNEFVFSPYFLSDPFHIYYYNFVKGAITRVVIQGMGASERSSIFSIFLNHIEDVKLMELF